jgi:hypothetical protein
MHVEIPLDTLKFLVTTAFIWLILSSLVVVSIASTEYRMLVMRAEPLWGFMLLLFSAGCISFAVTYYWFFQRFTFYGPMR